MSADRRQETVAYLLGELDGPARTAFEARLAADATLRGEVEALSPVVGRLDGLDAAAWEPLEAPAPPRLAPPSAERSRRRLAFPAWGVAAACALLGLGVLGAILLTGQRAPDGPSVALAPVGAPSGASGKVSLKGGEAVVRIEGLPPTAKGDFYELWLLNTPTDLVSLGSFRVSESGAARLRLPVPVDRAAFRYLDVSLEPGDGDPGHSKRSVLRAPTRASS